MAVELMADPWEWMLGMAEAYQEAQEQTVLGFTGTQGGMTDDQKRSISVTLSSYRKTTLHHGVCVGADAEVNDIARGFGIRTVGWPGLDAHGKQPKLADVQLDQVHSPLPYLVRNRLIVEACELLLVAPAEHVEQLRSGTWSTYRYAREFGVPTLITFPDGSQRFEP